MRARGDFIMVRIQSDGIDRFAVADGTTPRCGRAAARTEVHGATRAQQRGITPSGVTNRMALCRCWLLYQRTKA